ncbi:hypothetical protein EI71_01022 [Anaeroplasma bactoclasticum]|uniref:Uncharacterized protein n=1 Tax=Anaeroplasma bactoclasticum TaxID=2088 RepID=A0A397RND4_9MOLU|nr:hypothetical protein [Anaeroplasma bactoclasticum]RIA75850.1 hypothetical protein EI71_01022 [Anaeroplasma bactoclasticum]
MIKHTLKCYLLSLKWAWIPLLIMACCLVPAIIYFIIVSQGAMEEMNSSLSEEIGQLSYTIEDMINHIFDSAKSLPWSTPFQAIKRILFEGWLSEVIEEFIAETEGSVYAQAMSGNIKDTANAIVGGMSVFPIAIVVGLLASYLFTASFLRKKNCPRSIWRTILNVLIDLFFTTVLLAGVVSLLGLWAASVFISSIVIAILYGFISITEAYISHRDKDMKFKDIVNPKTIASLLISYFILLIFAIAIIALFFLIPYKIISVCLSLPVIVLTFINYNLAAESYVASKRKEPYKKMPRKKKEKKKISSVEEDEKKESA